METQSPRPIQFNGTAGGIFVAMLVNWLYGLIPIVGWALGTNYFGRWIAKNSKVNGQDVKFTATLGDTFWFILGNVLLVIITLGIYIFWYIPKLYCFIADHVEYVVA
jgi:uncharacterized membrane protein YjgN (DUF898 family)